MLYFPKKYVLISNRHLVHECCWHHMTFLCCCAISGARMFSFRLIEHLSRNGITPLLKAPEGLGVTQVILNTENTQQGLLTLPSLT